jgi:hypothetical protein
MSRLKCDKEFVHSSAIAWSNGDATSERFVASIEAIYETAAARARRPRPPDKIAKRFGDVGARPTVQTR